MAKRVNTRFLIGLTAVVAVLLGGVVVASVVLNRKDPQKYLNLAEQAIANKEYGDALGFLGSAIGADENNPALYTRYGDVYDLMAGEDPENLMRARAAWSKAIAIDPRHAPALQRLLDSYWDEAEFSPYGRLFAEIIDVAGKLERADPAAPKVSERKHIATVRAAQVGEPIKLADLEASGAALAEMAKKDPANADLPRYIAATKLFRAAEHARKVTRRNEVRKLLGEAAKVFDEAAKGQEDNAAMQLRAYETYAACQDVAEVTEGQAAKDKRGAAAADKAGTDEAGGKGALLSKVFAAKAAKAVAAAGAAVKADDPLYVEVQMAAANQAARQRRLDDARRVIEALMDARPDDTKVRLVYARAASQGLADRARAIELLDRPIDEQTTGFTGAKALLIRGLRFQAYYELTNLRLGEAQAARDTAKRDELFKQAKDSFNKFADLAPSADHPLVYTLRGRMQELGAVPGGRDAAIQSYEKALSRMGAGKESRVVFDLARLYLLANQTGLTKNLLNDNMERLRTVPLTHELMATALLAEHNAAEAEKHIRVLEQEFPEASAARIAALMKDVERVKNPEQAREAAEAEAAERVAKLPEKTRDEKLRKAASAFQLKDYAETIRLGKAMLKDDPRDLVAVELLMQSHLAEGRRDEAREVVVAARTHAPDDKLLELWAGQLAPDATPEQVRKLEEQFASAEKDRFVRSLRLSDIARKYGDAAGAARHLDDAEAQRPGDANVNVVGRRFNLAVAQGKWDEAGALVERRLSRGDPMDGWGFRYDLARGQGDWAKAEKAAREMIKRRRNYAQNHAALAVALQQQGKYPDAMKSYETTLQMQPRNVNALRGMIECYFALNDVEETRKAIERARALHPNDASFRETALAFELQHGDVDAAVKAREDLLARNPKDPSAVLTLAATYVQAVRAKHGADPKKKAELLGKARKLLRDGLAQWKDDPRFHATLADAMLVGGDVKGGEKLLMDYAAGPGRADSPQPFVMLADFYTRANNLPLAATSLNSALSKLQRGSTGDLQVRARLSNVLAQLNRHDDALKVLEGIPQLTRQRVQVLARAGRVEDAEKELMTLVAGREKTPAALTDLAGFYVDTNQHDKAAEAVDGLLAADKDSDVGLYYRGLLKTRRAEPDLAGAIRDLSTVVRHNPRHAQALLLLAEAYQDARKPANAAQTLRAAITLMPTNREVRAELVELQMNHNQWPDVIQVAEEARKRPTMANDPTWPRAIGLAHSALGRHDAAEREIRRALDLVAQSDRDRITSDLLDVLLKAGKPDAVLAEGAAVIKAAGGESSAPWFAFYNRGLALGRKGNRVQAVKELDKALGRLDPMDDLQRDSAGKVVRSMAAVSGDPKVALKRIGPWAEKDPGWRLTAAQLHLRAREMDKVIELAESVLAAEKDGKLTPVMLAEAYRTLGDAYQQAQPPRFEKAIDVYTKMVERFPEDVVALNNLAYLLAEEVTPRQPQRAKKYSQQAYDIVKNWNPIDVLVVDTHGWILVQTGDKKDLQQGISHLRLVVTERPKLLEARYHLGEAYLRSNSPQEAEKELRAAAELLDQASRQKLPFDPRLASRIKEARDRAQQMMRAGADAGR